MERLCYKKSYFFLGQNHSNFAHSPVMIVLGFRCRFYVFIYLFLAYMGLICSSSIQISPKGEVILIVVAIQRVQYLPNQLDKNEIVTQDLCLQFTSISGNCQVIFTVLLQIQYEVIIFLLPVNTNKPKFVTFLDKLFLCTTASFIAQISSSENLNVLKRDAILAQVAKQ